MTTCTRTHAFARPKTNAKRSTDLPGGGTLGSAAACCVVPSKLGTLLALITEPSCVGAAFCTNLQSASNCHVASRSDRAGRPRQPWGLPIPDPSSYGELDEQITCLMRCQPLPEADVKALCDKAREILVSASIASFAKP